jgi:hypothetical protein
VCKRCEDTSHSKSPAPPDENDLHYDVSAGPLSIIRDQIKNSKKNVDTLLGFHLACSSPSRVYRRGNNSASIYEKEIHFKIRFL